MLSIQLFLSNCYLIDFVRVTVELFGTSSFGYVLEYYAVTCVLSCFYISLRWPVLFPLVNKLTVICDVLI